MKIPTEAELMNEPCNKGYEDRQTFDAALTTVLVFPNPTQQRPIRTLAEILAKGREWPVTKKGRVWWTLGDGALYLNTKTGEVNHHPKSDFGTPMDIGFPSRQALIDAVMAAKLAFAISSALREGDAGSPKNLPVLREIAAKLTANGL